MLGAGGQMAHRASFILQRDPVLSV